MVELFAPKHAGESLALNKTFIVRHARRSNRVIKLVRLSNTCREDLLEGRTECIFIRLVRCETQLYCCRLASANRKAVASRRLGSNALAIHRFLIAADN